MIKSWNHAVVELISKTILAREVGQIYNEIVSWNRTVGGGANLSNHAPWHGVGGGADILCNYNRRRGTDIQCNFDRRPNSGNRQTQT